MKWYFLQIYAALFETTKNWHENVYQQWTVEKHITQPYNMYEIQYKNEEVPLCIMLYGLQEHILKDKE